MGLGSIIARAFVRAAVKGVQDAARESVRIDRLNQRLSQLGKVHVSMATAFVEPLIKVINDMTPKDSQRLKVLLDELAQSAQWIGEHLNETNEHHLNRYATAVRRTAIVAMKLCQKYGIYSDIYSVDYDASRKMIMLNGKDQYSLIHSFPLNEREDVDKTKETIRECREIKESLETIISQVPPEVSTDLVGLKTVLHSFETFNGGPAEEQERDLKALAEIKLKVQTIQQMILSGKLKRTD